MQFRHIYLCARHNGISGPYKYLLRGWVFVLEVTNRVEAYGIPLRWGNSPPNLALSYVQIMDRRGRWMLVRV